MGFTLIELVITFGVVLILITVSISLTVNFSNHQDLDDATYQLISILRQAQNKAMAVEDDSNFGVLISNLNFVLFKGVNYVDRDPVFDFIVQVPNNLDISGPNEIVFAKLSGLPNTLANITVSGASQSNTIEINEIGRINLQ